MYHSLAGNNSAGGDTMADLSMVNDVSCIIGNVCDVLSLLIAAYMLRRQLSGKEK